MPKLESKQLANMLLPDLIIFWNADWEKETPLLRTPDNHRIWAAALSNRSDIASPLEILQALHEYHKVSDEWVEEIDEMKDKFLGHFAFTMQEQITALQNTVQVLLDHHKHDNANITIGQYNRMMEGM